MSTNPRKQDKPLQTAARRSCRGAWLVGVLLLGVGCAGEVASVAIGSGGMNVGTGLTGGAGSTMGGTSGTVGSGGNGAMGGSGGTGPACATISTVPRRLWRLSNLQYTNAVRDLLQVTNVPEVTGGGTALLAFYSKDTEVVDDRLEFSYYQAAETVVGALDPIKLAACKNGEAENACAQRMITTLATNGYRRPVTSIEVTDLMAIYTEGRKVDFATGIRLMVEGMLLAPSFAYRSEVGATTTGTATLTPYEVASQLSFIFLNSIPDIALMTAASDGSLGTPAGIATQVDRLLGMPQAQANIARIVIDWFGARETQGKSATEFPQYNADLQADLVKSSSLWAEDTLWKNGKRLEDLLTSSRLFMSPRMAPVYGFTVPAGTAADAFVAVTAPDGQRSGILTLPGMMSAKAGTAETSVVKRGRFVSDEILCGTPLPEPPVALINSEDVQAALALLKTEEERSTYRLVTNSSCKACHLRMDPYGVLLENADAIGRYRTTLHDGGPVKATWELALSPSLTGTFTGPSKFAQGLITDKIFSACATRKMASYALGADQPMSCELQTIQNSFEASADHSMSTLLRELTLASFMRTRGAK